MDPMAWKEKWEERSRVADTQARDGMTGLTEDQRVQMTDYILENLDFQATHHVLEVGCGSGWFLRRIEPRVAHVTGTDISPGMLSHHTGTATLIACEAADISVPDESFDRILMVSVSHYFPSFDYLSRVIHKIYDALRPNGRILITDVHFSMSQAPEYTHYDVTEVFRLLESLGSFFSILAQPRIKRDFHQSFCLRYDILICKD